MRITVLTDKQRQIAKQSEFETRRSLIGKTIRETARAMGHGDELVSWDGGEHWHAKKDIRCSGDSGSVLVEAPDGSSIAGSIWHLMSRQRNELMREAEQRLMEIADAIGEDTPEPSCFESATLVRRFSLMSGADWLWCTIMMADGDVTI